ncbi:MAG: VCBS repeat-containing protein [candidate division Zixibacteria bacterium]|nr:VCBS repeat-containing protein [candidate division Zixibacteria bacterium]
MTKQPVWALAAVSFFLLIVVQTAAGQSYTRSVTPFPVTREGEPVALPFLGGINEAKPSLVDFDGDDRLDLLIGERSGKILYLRNTAPSGEPAFEVISNRLGGVDVGSWFAAVDIDADGDMDLFCDNRNGGVEFHRNDQPGLSPDFVLVDSSYDGLMTGVNNTPVLFDIDSDGDLDFFLGGVTGTLAFYRNDGDSTTPSFTFITDSYDSIAAFPGGGAKRTADQRHGFSCIHFADINDDGDGDLFWGDINNVNLYLFANLGTPNVSDLTYETDTFLPGNTVGFNHATTADIDGDGDLDLLIGVGNGSALDNLRLYRNNGSASSASYVLENLNFVDNIDVGSNAFPAIGDIDADGDLDMIIGRFDGRLTLYENTGTPLRPVLSHRTDFFASIDVGTFAAPVLVDWDSDGRLDLLIGTGGGRIEYWRNIGTADSIQLVQESNQLAGIQVDQYATPRSGDLNGDGLTDLVVGEWDFNSRANIRLYQNTGAEGNPSLSLVTAALLPVITPRDYASAQIYDGDGDGRPDVIAGTAALGLTLWRNAAAPGQMPDSLTLIPQSAVIPGTDDGLFPAVVFADFDGDGDDDAVVGEGNGGLNYWSRDGSCCSGTAGNVDADSSGAVEIADIVRLVDWLFLGGSDLSCLPAANVDGDAMGVVDLRDAIYLINAVILGGPPPAPCN